jgi:hypothetical protein
VRQKISRTSNDEVVDDDDRMAIVKQAIDKMTSDETGSTGNDAFHAGNIRSAKCPPEQASQSG